MSGRIGEDKKGGYRYNYQSNREGNLRVQDEPPHTIRWSEFGNPKGEPVIYLHGGTQNRNVEELVRMADHLPPMSVLEQGFRRGARIFGLGTESLALY